MLEGAESSSARALGLLLVVWGGLCAREDFWLAFVPVCFKLSGDCFEPLARDFSSRREIMWPGVLHAFSTSFGIIEASAACPNTSANCLIGSFNSGQVSSAFSSFNLSKSFCSIVSFESRQDFAFRVSDLASEMLVALFAVAARGVLLRDMINGPSGLGETRMDVTSSNYSLDVGPSLRALAHCFKTAKTAEAFSAFHSTWVSEMSRPI